MKIYVPLHFEHKNHVTIIVKLLYEATSGRRSFIMIGTLFLCKNVIEHKFSWNKCFIIYLTNETKNGAPGRYTLMVVKLKLYPLQHLFIFQS